MEIYKRTVGYEQFGKTTNLVVTATTLNFPFMLKQSFEDIGIYTDVENPVYEIVDLSGIWNTSNNGSGQKPCLTLNNCNITITQTLPVTYYGANNGQLTASVAGCPSPQTLQWSGPNGFTSNAYTISNLISGNYTLKVTDANCDISYSSFFLPQPQGLSLSLLTVNSQTSANIGCNGTASVTPQGGLPPYTYTWYSVPPPFTGSTIIAGPSTTLTGLTSLCAGVYTVQITDSTPTTVSATFTITAPSAVSGTVVSTVNIDCNGGNTGVITLSASGGIAPTGYTYVLSGPSPSTNSGGYFSGLLAGSYTAQIFDSVGNFTTLGPINITQPVAVTYSSPSSYITCFGASNGSITINPAGGTPPYALTVNRDQGTGYGSYLTTSIGGSYTLSNLDIGNYQISLKDSKNCPGPTNVVTILQRYQFTLNYTLPATVNGYNIACFGNTILVPTTSLYTISSFAYNPGSSTINYYVNGSLQASASGPPAFVNLILGAGTNQITAVNGFNCSATTVVTLTQPPMPLTFTTGIIDSSTGTTCSACKINDCRQAIIDINGGVAPYTITWSDGSTYGLTSFAHCKGSVVSVFVTDANGCTTLNTPITLSP